MGRFIEAVLIVKQDAALGARLRVNFLILGDPDALGFLVWPRLLVGWMTVVVLLRAISGPAFVVLRSLAAVLALLSPAFLGGEPLCSQLLDGAELLQLDLILGFLRIEPAATVEGATRNDRLSVECFHLAAGAHLRHLLDLALEGHVRLLQILDVLVVHLVHVDAA